MAERVVERRFRPEPSKRLADQASTCSRDTPLEAHRKNARRLAKASNLRQKHRDSLQKTARLRRADPAEYRRTRELTLKSVRDIRATARKLTAKVEKYAKRNRYPLRMMRKRKDAERRKRLTFPLIAGDIRFLDDSRTELCVHGFGDLILKRPLSDGMEPVSLTLVARRKRRHRKQRTAVRLEQLEWSAHVQYRRYVDQKPVTPDSPSVGIDPSVKHAATTQDDQGQITHHHYTGTGIPVKNTSRRCAQCGCTAKEHRESQAAFRCKKCGHTANADANAAENMRQGAVTSLLAKPGRREAARRRAASTVPRSQRKPAAKTSPRHAGAPYKATGAPPTTTTTRKKRDRSPTQEIP